MNISNVSQEFIENALLQSLNIARENLEYLTEASGTYFAGRTLCIDFKDEHDDLTVITCSYSEESVGFFSGGSRKMLSMKSMRLLHALSNEWGINQDYNDKWEYDF